jgi:glycosyltransferase involved in cell wall biosynthesis
MPTLHVVMPVYNERKTLEPCVRRLLGVAWPAGWDATVTIVDDHSEETAFEVARGLVETLAGEGHAARLTRHEVNRGKGAALQTGFDVVLARGAAGGDLVGVQDADLEYDPADLPALMAPIIAGDANAVVGTRWGDHVELVGVKRKVHAWGNRMLTRLSNAMTGYRVSDMECCYKVMTVATLRRLRPMLTECRFGIEPQMVAGLARLRETLLEVPVTYDPRGLDAGKKIGWTDGVRAIYVIGRERLRGAPDDGAPASGTAR